MKQPTLKRRVDHNPPTTTRTRFILSDKFKKEMAEFMEQTIKELKECKTQKYI